MCSCVLVEPEGSIYGGKPPGPKKIEGIATEGFYPEIFDPSLADQIMMVTDEEHVRRSASWRAARASWEAGHQERQPPLLNHVAERLGQGKRVITVFPDGAERYLSQES